ncbi:MAG: ATP-binding protein [Muribaculaceae bacterium]|nr:ATP-binding protein [Muribaculaceae bacterium]
MALKTFFYLFVLMQAPACVAVMMLSYESRPWLFYCAELLLLGELIVAVLFYRKVMRPLAMLRSGLSLLRSQDWNVKLRLTGQREVDEVVDVFNNMISKLHTQAVAMSEQRHFLSLLVEVSPSGIVVCDFDGRVRMANPAAFRLLGVDDAARLPEALDAIPHDVVRRPDGRVLRVVRRHFVEDGVRHAFYLIEDVTKPVATAEKEAYGKLIRLIAHEVNNTVGGLVTALGALEGRDSDDDALVGACRSRAMGLSAFIGRFAEVVKIPSPQRLGFDIAAAVAGMKPFLESLCSKSGAHLDLAVPACPVEVCADWAMMEQVIVNVVKNAVESAGRGGCVRIEVTKSPRGIVVADNGPGIDAEKSARIFTPFFTDKPSGQGIGLTFVREVLTAHGCSYTLSTDPTDGLTRFRIWF